jgi:hypothetical protein
VVVLYSGRAQGKKLVQLQRIVALVYQIRAVLRQPIDLAAIPYPTARISLPWCALWCSGHRSPAFRRQNPTGLTWPSLRQTARSARLCHVDPAPDAGYFFPSACDRMAKILPMNVIGRGALILNFFLRLGFACGVVLISRALARLQGLAFGCSFSTSSVTCKPSSGMSNRERAARSAPKPRRGHRGTCPRLRVSWLRGNLDSVQSRKSSARSISWPATRPTGSLSPNRRCATALGSLA